MGDPTLCADYPNLAKWINICEYSVSEVTIIMIGTLLWVVAYYFIIRNAFRNKYIEMPVIVATANLAWEFAWSWCFETNMGELFLWGFRLWFFMDLFIFWNVLKHGHKQVTTPQLAKYFKPITVGMLLGWFALFYFFIKQGLDTPIGATSAYLITVCMASLYVTTFLSSGENKKYYSLVAAWCKGVGNSFMTTFVFMAYPENYWLQVMTVICLLYTSPSPRDGATSRMPSSA